MTQSVLNKSYKIVVSKILNDMKPDSILDIPSGDGWLLHSLNYTPYIYGIDLYEEKPYGYNGHSKFDLNIGLPNLSRKFSCVVTCEGIEHIGNPLLFLQNVKKYLKKNSVLIITTPNIWYPASKLKYFIRGFFPSFPPLIGKINYGSHMHIIPWSYAQLYLFLKLAGFSDIILYDLPEKKPKHIFETMLAIPQKLYCKAKLKKSKTKEEIDFWTNAKSNQSIYGRRLVISAKNK